MAAIVYESLFSRTKWRRCCLFLPSRNGGSVCLFVFVPQCLWGEGATAANAVEMRPLMADTP